MKNVWLVLLLAIPLGCQPPADSKPADSNTTSSVPDETATHLVFAVDGMSCEIGCPPAVKQAFASVPGVKDVQVDFNTKQATVNVDQEFDQVAAVKALGDAGFTAAKL